MGDPVKVLFFGVYDPAGSRPRVLVKGLALNGVEVAHCRTTARRLPFAYLDLMRRFDDDVDVVLVCTPGQHLVPIARWLVGRQRIPIILDAMYSEYDTYVNDRRTVRRYSVGALRYYAIDRLSCHLANTVIVDTELDAGYFQRTFGMRPARFKRIFVGSDDEVFVPLPKSNDDGTFRVGFVGGFIPLQGVNYIVQAAKILEREADVHFFLVGEGQTYPAAIELATRLNVRNVTFQPWMAYESLPAFLKNSDVCLGIFGDGDKAKRVIPTKAFDALAMAKPLITGDSPGAKEAGFEDRENAFLVEMRNPSAIARAILDAKSNNGLRRHVAEQGHRLFKQRFTPKIIGATLKAVLEEVAPRA